MATQNMTSSRQDAISILAQMSDSWLKDFLGDAQILKAKFAGTDFGNKVLMIYGVQITQEDLDSIPSFQANNLTIQNCLDDLYVIFGLTDSVVNGLQALDQMTKVK